MAIGQCDTGDEAVASWGKARVELMRKLADVDVEEKYLCYGIMSTSEGGMGRGFKGCTKRRQCKLIWMCVGSFWWLFGWVGCTEWLHPKKITTCRDPCHFRGMHAKQ